MMLTHVKCGVIILPLWCNYTTPYGVITSIVQLQVNATERDSGSGLGIMYSFVTVSTSEFAINPNTGIITVSPMLDREEISQYILTVQATDLGGLGGLAGFAQVYEAIIFH